MFPIYIYLYKYLESRSEISEALAKTAILRAHKHHTSGQRLTADANRLTMIWNSNSKSISLSWSTTTSLSQSQSQSQSKSKF